MSYGFEHLTVAYGGHVALRDVSLRIPAGAVTALVGGDGAGKTTLLRALAGRVRPTGGRMWPPPLDRVGVLTAGPPGYGDLTVEENLRFVARVRGLERRWARERSEGLLAATRLADARGRLADRLSGGMRRMLGFALATLHAPDVLLLDEPTTGVDPVSRTELWRLMAGAAGSGNTVVFSTTYLDEAERCAQVLALDRGRVLAAGDPDRIIGAVRGLYDSADRGPAQRSWRRGAGWRVWMPDGAPGLAPAEPDLEDAVVIAMLRRSQTTGTSAEVS